MKLRYNSTVTILALMLGLFSTTRSAALGKQKILPPPELYQMMLTAQKGTAVADKKMIDIMNEAADRLQLFYKRTHRLPTAGQESDDLVERMNRWNHVNPYCENDLLEKQLSKDTPRRVLYKLEIDYGLNQQQLSTMSSTSPQKWLGPVGTIHLIHNSDKLIAVWGSGVDGHPVIDRTTGKIAVVYRLLN